MMTFEQWCEELIEGFVNLFNVVPSELWISVHYDDSIFLNDRLNFLYSLLVRKTSIMRRLFLIIKLNWYFILRLLMDNILIYFLIEASLWFLGA